MDLDVSIPEISPVRITGVHIEVTRERDDEKQDADNPDDDLDGGGVMIEW